jgi:hypothetical protein
MHTVPFKAEWYLYVSQVSTWNKRCILHMYYIWAFPMTFKVIATSSLNRCDQFIIVMEVHFIFWEVGSEFLIV